ncbi:MAG: MASE1 domain-containing protein [Betaproteobacteria bacterium]|nr:MASE1 domain-containing protein [Betaproteobacteria bacterium]
MAPPSPYAPPAAGRAPWAIGAAYVAVFLALDWVSYIRPFQGLNITPWNPQPALAVALLIVNPRWLWLVWLSLVTAELAVRGLPADWFVTLAATAVLGLCYAAIARTLQARLDPTSGLARRADLLRFTVIIVGGALVSGTAYVATFYVGGIGPRGEFFEAVARFWVGDAVGMIVLLPMLLMLLHPARRASLAATLRNREAWLIALAIAALVLLVFGRADRDHFKFFYVLLLPVVWAAARLGLSGAVLAAGLTQIGLIAAVQSAPNADLTVFELQVLMAVVTMTGLMLGVVVDERERAAIELKGSLRLAAAGQMAAALAHELSQPLTALNSYAQAARQLAASADIPEAERLPRLLEVSGRMADDALRASDVVKRLRDFFRSGSTQLRVAAIGPLIDDVVAAGSRRAAALGVRVDVDLDPALPRVLMDEVQIAVVLRNLMANALDAASANAGNAANAANAAPRAVRVHARLRKGSLGVDVFDSGSGVPADRLPTLFEPGPSEKAGGMGVGLSICRAIVEAHGGQLWAEPGPSGHFAFTLPLADGEPAYHAP